MSNLHRQMRVAANRTEVLSQWRVSASLGRFDEIPLEVRRYYASGDYKTPGVATQHISLKDVERLAGVVAANMPLVKTKTVGGAVAKGVGKVAFAGIKAAFKTLLK